MILTPLLAQYTPPDPQPFIDTYGPVLGLILVLALFALGGGLVMLYSKLNSATKAQDAITKAFGEQAAEIGKLRAQVETLDKTADSAKADRDRLKEELDITRRTAEAAQSAQHKATERAAALEQQMNELRAKIAALETERQTRMNDLKRETERATKLEQEVTDLRGRVARLEGENSALRQVIDKLNVVSVRPPDPDPPTEPKVIPIDAAQEKAA